jgi:hypothetical protein
LDAAAKSDVNEAKEMEKKSKVKVKEAKASVTEAKAAAAEAKANAAAAAKKVKQPLDLYANTVTFTPIKKVVYCWNLDEALQKHKGDKGARLFLCVVLCVVLCCVVLCCVGGA